MKAIWLLWLNKNEMAEQERKLFVGVLNLETTEETLKEYFPQWWELMDIVLMPHPNTNKSRGFAFVTKIKNEM